MDEGQVPDWVMERFRRNLGPLPTGEYRNALQIALAVAAWVLEIDTDNGEHHADPYPDRQRAEYAYRLLSSDDTVRAFYEAVGTGELLQFLRSLDGFPFRSYPNNKITSIKIVGVDDLEGYLREYMRRLVDG